MPVDISVILPVYNGSAYLKEAIQSVLSQSFPSLELIIVDDGSTDDSPLIVQELMQIDQRIRYLTQENSGVSAARNTGITASNGRFIAFLDQDDRWTTEALHYHITYHQQNVGVGYTLGHQICFLEEDCTPPAWFKLQMLDVPHVGYLPGTLMVKQSVFQELGLFDTRYAISSDADWFARANDTQIPMYILPQLILERRIHNENQSQQSRQIHRELFELLSASIRRKKQGENESDSS